MKRKRLEEQQQQQKEEEEEEDEDVPLVVEGGVDTWVCREWKEQDWVEVLGKGKQIQVRIGEINPVYNHPTWERCTEVVNVDVASLLTQEGRKHLVGEGRWAYWDYKRMSHLMSRDHLASFTWNRLGLPDRTGEQSTMWVGTRGAHTPCHQDTYGCNLVAQIVGSKTWTLFPPSQGPLIQPGRVPYEESSIYSGVNFCDLSRNSEAVLDTLSQTTPYIVTLKPGQVLYVPRHWWHFVYNEEYSVSVNTWLEHPGDHRARLEEMLVRIQAASLAQLLPPSISQSQLLNPNECDLIECSIESLSKLSTIIAKKAVQNQLMDDYPCPNLGSEVFPVKKSRFNLPVSSLIETSCDPPEHPMVAAFRAFTAQHVIQAAAEEYLKNMK